MRFQLPDVCDGVFVFIVGRPYCYLVALGSDVDDGAAHVVAVVIKSLANKTQELKRERFQNTSLLGNTSVAVRQKLIGLWH